MQYKLTEKSVYAMNFNPAQNRCDSMFFASQEKLKRRQIPASVFNRPKSFAALIKTTSIANLLSANPLLFNNCKNSTKHSPTIIPANTQKNKTNE